MALDHVRDFFMTGADADPVSNPDVSAAVFATRWVTHICAPVFVLLAGTSAGLMTRRKNKSELRALLLSRGIWLILVDWFVVSTSLTLSPGGMSEVGGRFVAILQVLWAIGGSMMVLAFAQLMGRRKCLLIGCAIVCGHNLLDAVWPQTSILEETWPLWVSLHSPMSYGLGPFLIVFQYPILPWVGVMLLGFGIAEVFEWPSSKRSSVLLQVGGLLIAVFLVLRAADIYGDPNGWEYHPSERVRTIKEFLNTTKYPPSLSFLLMTLGPASMLCGCIDHLPQPILKIFVDFGRAPFAFYVFHFYLIRLLSSLLAMTQGFDISQTATHFLYFPEEYGVSLIGVYLAWVLVLTILYPLCRYVTAVKKRSRAWWLSYL